MSRILLVFFSLFIITTAHQAIASKIDDDEARSQSLYQEAFEEKLP